MVRTRSGKSTKTTSKTAKPSKRKTATKSSKRKTATKCGQAKSELERLCDDLKKADVGSLRGDVIARMNTEYHMQFFKDRHEVWRHITKNISDLNSFISAQLVDFINMYKKNYKGKEKYTHLLLDWYKHTRGYVTGGGEITWRLLICDYSTSVDETTRSCVLSSLMMSVFHEMLSRVECHKKEKATVSSFLPSTANYESDDDASLQRLGGFALFSCIQVRERKLMWKTHLDVSHETAKTLHTELSLLKQLKDEEKSDLPAAIAFQDRGHMTIMKPSLLPFIRNTVTEVRKLLNYQEYSKHGKDFFKNVQDNLPISSISRHFRDCTESLLVATPIEVLNSLCEQLVLKISHTISNDFLRNVSTLENLKDKKATDAQMSLRDELKTFAAHKSSKFSAKL